MTKLDYGPFGMIAGGLLGFFAVFKVLPMVGAKTWPIMLLTTIATLVVIAGGAVGYKLVARPRPYEKAT